MAEQNDFETLVRGSFKAVQNDAKSFKKSIAMLESEVKAIKAVFDRLNKKVDVMSDKLSIIEKNFKSMVRVEGEDEDDGSDVPSSSEEDEDDADSLY